MSPVSPIAVVAVEETTVTTVYVKYAREGSFVMAMIDFLVLKVIIALAIRILEYPVHREPMLTKQGKLHATVFHMVC